MITDTSRKAGVVLCMSLNLLLLTVLRPVTGASGTAQVFVLVCVRASLPLQGLSGFHGPTVTLLLLPFCLF